jgi:hypothetical protein
MKKPLLVSSSLLAGLLVCLAAAPASAQDSTSPPPAAASTSPPPASSSSMGGGAIGVGAVVWLGPTGNNAPVTGGEFVYDMSQFHIEGVFGFSHASQNGASSTGVDVGVAGWYHLAKGNMADFSVGGGAGLAYFSAPGAGNSSTGFSLEPGAEARVFLSPNFSLSARVGFAIGFGDNNSPTTFGLGGATTGTTGGLGFTYFFR